MLVREAIANVDNKGTEAMFMAGSQRRIKVPLALQRRRGGDSKPRTRQEMTTQKSYGNALVFFWQILLAMLYKWIIYEGNGAYILAPLDGELIECRDVTTLFDTLMSPFSVDRAEARPGSPNVRVICKDRRQIAKIR
jgi:hypothetical protein